MQQRLSIMLLVFLVAVMMPNQLQAQDTQNPCVGTVPTATTYKDGMCYFTSWSDCTFSGGFPFIEPVALKSADMAKELILTLCPLSWGSCPFPVAFIISATGLPSTIPDIEIDPNLQQNVANGDCAVLTGTWVNGGDISDYNLKIASSKTCDSTFMRSCQFKLSCPDSTTPAGFCYNGGECPNYNADCVDNICCERTAVCPDNRKVFGFCSGGYCPAGYLECVSGTCCEKL